MIIQNSFIVIVGNSFSVKDTLKTYGFKFEPNHRVWYKLASEQTRAHWEKELNNDQISVCHVTDLSQIPAMIEAHKEFQKEMMTTEVKPLPHILNGAVVEMSKWYAQMFKQNNNTSIAFRNLKILNVYLETQKAYLVDVEFYGGVACTCGVCGRNLENAISMATGIGPICAEKLGMPRISNVEDAKIIVEEMKKMSQMHGIFKQVWIPKSQIKNTIKNESELNKAV